MATFILKTEPGEYSYDDLAHDKKTVWSGITSAPALAHLRTAKKGDQALIYHTGDEKQIVGLAKITTGPYEDPDQPGTNARGEPKFAVVDLAPVKKAKTPVTLAAIKADRRFATLPLVTQSRLSVVPVPPALDAILREMAGL